MRGIVHTQKLYLPALIADHGERGVGKGGDLPIATKWPALPRAAQGTNQPAVRGHGHSLVLVLGGHGSKGTGTARGKRGIALAPGKVKSPGAAW